MMKVRRCLFRGTTRSTSGDLFECYCTEAQAWSALNFIRFLD